MTPDARSAHRDGGRGLPASRRSSVPAGWASSTGRSIRGSTGTSRSSCSRPSSRRTVSTGPGSSRESRQAAAIEHPSIVPGRMTPATRTECCTSRCATSTGLDLGRTIAREGPLRSGPRGLRARRDRRRAGRRARARSRASRRQAEQRALCAPDAGGRERAYLTDFGISKLVAGRGRAHRDRSCPRVPAEYVAPELVEGG